MKADLVSAEHRVALLPERGRRAKGDVVPAAVLKYRSLVIVGGVGGESALSTVLDQAPCVFIVVVACRKLDAGQIPEGVPVDDKAEDDRSHTRWRADPSVKEPIPRPLASLSLDRCRIETSAEVRVGPASERIDAVRFDLLLVG
jgi:hypothetical protein